MAIQSAPCSDESLRLLLSGDDTSEEFRRVASHVETCKICQARLSTLAAEPQWWDEAQSLLDEAWDQRWDPSVLKSDLDATREWHEQQTIQETVRRIVGPPTHPELLGRLGRYDIERVIGTGGMGIVVKAHDGELNRPVAIKLLAAHLAHVGAARARFAREGRAAAAVVHEHVVAIYNVESEGAVPFLVMQYVPGRSLQARVDEDGPLDTEAILRIGMQAAAGLAAAHHQGLIHRDVKPSNILLEDSVERAVLTDFGLARTFDDASLTQTGIVAGTPHYMSPEQATGGAIDHRSDLFSLGAVLYFMATGHPPFRADGALAVLNRICHDQHRPAWQSNQTIPDELSDVIDRLLEKKPGNRYASALEVQNVLASLLNRWQRQGLGRRRRLWRGARRRLAIGLTVATLTVAGAGIALWIKAPWRLDVPPVESGESVEALLAPIVEADQQFATELADVQQHMRNDTRETIYLQHGDDVWQQEIEALKRDVAAMESSNR